MVFAYSVHCLLYYFPLYRDGVCLFCTFCAVLLPTFRDDACLFCTFCAVLLSTFRNGVCLFCTFCAVLLSTFRNGVCLFCTFCAVLLSNFRDGVCLFCTFCAVLLSNFRDGVCLFCTFCAVLLSTFPRWCLLIMCTLCRTTVHFSEMMLAYSAHFVPCYFPLFRDGVCLFSTFCAVLLSTFPRWCLLILYLLCRIAFHFSEMVFAYYVPFVPYYFPLFRDGVCLFCTCFASS